MQSTMGKQRQEQLVVTQGPGWEDFRGNTYERALKERVQLAEEVKNIPDP